RRASGGLVMPNRIIKESICTSDTIDRLTAEEERFFYRLMVQADDFGRFDGRAPVVLASTFPLRAHEIPIEQVEAWLDRLAEVDLIRFYHVEGRRYVYFTTWDKHQQKRAKHSKYPSPDADEGPPQSSDINGNQMQADDINYGSDYEKETRTHAESPDIRCNQMKSYVPENRESRNEKREAEARRARARE